MLRDRLVCGVNHEGIQRKLLTEKDLTYEKALEISLTMETAEKGSKDLKTSDKPNPPGDLHYTSQKSRQQRAADAKPPSTTTCYRCLGKHLASLCKYRTAECLFCKKIGHIAKACRSKKAQERQKSTKIPQQTKKTLHMEEAEINSEEQDSSYQLFTLESNGQNPITVQVELNEVPTEMEVDTGSSLSLINKSTYDLIASKNQIQALQKSKVKLKTYTVEILGTANVEVTYGETKHNLVIHVVDGKGPNLMGRDWLSSLRLTINNINSLSTTSAVQGVLDTHATVFSDKLGTFKGAEVRLHVDAHIKPQFFKARSIPFALKSKVEAELERLESLGIIIPVQHSNWAAPVVPVVKQDGTIRLCGDYRVTVNKAVKVDSYPLPRVVELFAALSGGKYFTKLDMSQAYLQLPLDKQSRELVTINTHRGLFQYTRLPFGVSAAPGVFQRCMENLLQGCKGVSVYLDDILVTGSTVEEHLQNLDKVLNKLEMAGLKLNKAKCSFLMPQVEYLGHIIDQYGLHPTEKKVKAIKEAPQPCNVNDLRAFLGIINYYGKFMPNLATKLAPLHKLLQKHAKWQWGTQQIKAFQDAKNALQDNTLLVHYDSSKQLVLACDASPHGLGAVLSHIIEDDLEKPIAYASRTLTTAEKNYSQLEKEALAVVYAVGKFHNYLYGKHFIIESDHQPLSYIFNNSKAISPTASSRITRWALTLSAYSYTIKHKPGRNLGNADALSRLPQSLTTDSDCNPGDLVHLLNHLESTSVTSSHIRRWTDTDPTLSRVRQYILQGWPTTQLGEEFKPFNSRKDELSILDGCILWGARVVVPPPGQKSVLEELHETHLGVSKMKALARSYIWWPKMDTDIEALVKKCTDCQQSSSSPPTAPLHPWEWPAQPWSRLHLDFAGPFLGKMYLVLVDAHSKWLDVQIMNSITSEMTISRLRSIFATHGLPQQIVTDNGPTFTSEAFKEFTKLNGIKHTFSAPYHPV